MKFKLDNLLTMKELAAKLKVKERTVRGWRERGKIPFTRIGRGLRFDAGVVERILQRNAVEALADSPIQSLAEQGGAQTSGGDDQ